VDFTQVKSALDVGCGKGAWTWVIGSLLPEDAKVIGVDIEPEWIEGIEPPSDRFSFAIADANALPFEDESFDLVTCQTLLMHVQDYKKVLDEMTRVLKPGGLLILSEPTNMANISASNTAQQSLSLEERIDVARLHLICEKGRELCEKGIPSIGLHLNYLLPVSITHLHSFMSEKMMALTPPYRKEEERALLDFIYSITSDNWYYLWSKEEAKKCFFAIYPEEQQEFDRLWQIACKLNAIYRQQIQERKLGGVFGGHLILTIGRKQLQSAEGI
jgi:SAM-dependent methyltransferase